MNYKILIADDNPEIREILNVLLTSEGYEIIEAINGEEAIEKISSDIDLIILDIMMPKINGYRACVQIREMTNAPILFLSAKNQESDKTLGFSSGADDYLPKPFSYNELTSRVKALLRRYTIYQGKIEQEKPLEKQSQIAYEHLLLDTKKQKLWMKEQLVDLTDIEYQLLELFLCNQNQIFSAQHLYETIWNEAYFFSANNTIMVHIRNLRVKIEANAQDPQIIKTIWGKGYRCE